MLRTNRQRVISLFSVAILCRILFAIPAFINPDRAISFTDARCYEQLAINTIEHRIFSMDSIPPYRPDASRTPIYPLFIAGPYALFGRTPLLIVIIQIILGSIVPIYTFLICKKLTNNQLLSSGAGLLCALSPNQAFHSSLLLTETLFVFLLILSIYTFVLFLQKKRWHHLILTGFLLGITTLCRPVILYLLFILVPFLLWYLFNQRRFLLKVLASFLAVYFGVLAPWYFRNFRVFGQAVLVPVNLLPYHAALLNADLKGITLEEAQQELSEELGDRIKNDPRAAIENEVYMAKAGTKLGMEYIKKAPLTYGKIHLQGMVANVIIPLGFTPLTTYFTGKLPSAFPAKESILHDAFILLGKGKIGAAFSLIWQERIRSIPLIVLLAFITSLIFQAVILIGCVKFFKSSCFRNKQFYLLLFLVLYFLFVTGPLIDARFRIPIEPWLSILAICGLRRKNIVVLPGPV